MTALGHAFLNLALESWVYKVRGRRPQKQEAYFGIVRRKVINIRGRTMLLLLLLLPLLPLFGLLPGLFAEQPASFPNLHRLFSFFLCMCMCMCSFYFGLFR